MTNDQSYYLYLFRSFEFDYCYLFGVWNLLFGISKLNFQSFNLPFSD